MNRTDVAAYLTATGRIHGSLLPIDAYILGILDEVQKREKIRGNLFEIGVHQGKTAILLARAAEGDEVAGFCDVFEGGTGEFLANMKKFAPLPPERLQVFAKRSASLTADETTTRVRLFHIDGGHRAENVFTDLVTADRAVLADGLVVIDGVFDSHWPEVGEAFYSFVTSRPAALLPIFIGGNKVVLTRPDAVVEYEQHWSDLFEGVPFDSDWKDWLGRRVLTAIRTPEGDAPSLTSRLRGLIGR